MLTLTDRSLSLSNLLRPEVRADPYSFYRTLREHDPIHWDDEMGFWVLTRYADVAALYNDDRFSRAQGLWRGFDRLSPEQQTIAQPVYHSFSKTMFYADPPYHTHVRGLINTAFTPRRIEQLRPFIQRIVDELLDAIQQQGSADLIRDLAYPLPVIVIAELLGLPASDREKFKQWSDDLFAILGTVRKSDELLERAARSQAEMSEYVTALAKRRSADPRDDLLTALLSVVDDFESEGCPHLSAGRQTSDQPASASLTAKELIANINILLSTGHETTTNLIGNGLLALLRNPQQLNLLQERPELVAAAVEEMLRYDSPVQITYRSALADAEVGGKLIHAGELVNSVLGSANRDPQRYQDADRFEVTRAEGRHLSFGLGIHFCIGAALVRLEAEILFGTILKRFPQMNLANDTLEWQDHPIFRGLRKLQVTL